MPGINPRPTPKAVSAACKAVPFVRVSFLSLPCRGSRAYPLQQLLGPLADVLRSEAEFFQYLSPFGGRSEAFQTDHVSVAPYILPPTHGGAGFDGQGRQMIGKDLLLVGIRLFFEDAEA